MKNRKKFNELYKGIIGQEVKSDPYDNLNKNDCSVLNNKSINKEGSIINEYNRRDNFEFKDTKKIKSNKFNAKTIVNDDFNKSNTKSKEIIIQIYSRNLKKINKRFISNNCNIYDSYFASKKSFLINVFKSEGSCEIFFKDNINSLFDNSVRQENVSFIKENINKINNKPLSISHNDIKNNLICNNINNEYITKEKQNYKKYEYLGNNNYHVYGSSSGFNNNDDIENFDLNNEISKLNQSKNSINLKNIDSC